MDTRSLNNLKLEAGQNNPDAAKEAAKQFESLFMRELIKSMREATMKSGLLDGAQGDLGSGHAGPATVGADVGAAWGLVGAIARHSRARWVWHRPHLSVPSTLSLPQVTGRAGVATKAQSAHQHHHACPQGGATIFVQHLSSTAEAVAQESGIPASFMLGQAGHETGWGRSEIKTASGGSTSFNLFGIKAGKGLDGQGGRGHHHRIHQRRAAKVVAKFRAYDSLRRFVPRLRPAHHRQPPLRKSPGHGPDGFCRGLCRRTAKAATPQTPSTPETQRRHPERTAAQKAQDGWKRCKSWDCSTSAFRALMANQVAFADGWQQHCQRQHPGYSRQTVALQTVQGNSRARATSDKGWICAPSCATRASCSPARPQRQDR